MKIYYVANARMPSEKAHGIQMAKMTEALIEAGADITLVVPRRRGSPRDSLREFYGLRVDVPVRRLPILDLMFLGRAGFALTSLAFMCSYLSYLLAKRLRGEKFLVYTIDTDQFSFAFVPLVGVPYVAEIHDAKHWSIPFAVLLGKISGVFAVNSRVKNALVKNFGIDPHRFLVTPNGIDPALFRGQGNHLGLREELGLPADKRLALYAGRLIDWKGLHVLAEAAERLPDDSRIVIVGGNREELERLIGRPASHNIIFLGSHPFYEVPRFLSAADALVVLGTKRNEYSYLHTSPMKLFECMAAGRPILAADTPAIREIVGEDEVMFYAPDDPDDFTRKLQVIFRGGDEIARKAAAARTKSSQFTWKGRAERVLAFVRQCV